MMQYRFFIRLGSGGAPHAVRPIYKDDLSIDYEKESGQQFFRAKLSGKLSFVREDYRYIIGAPLETTFFLDIEVSSDWGNTWKPYYTGQFVMTDCTVNEADELITVQPDVSDVYNDILDGYENEYNLITCRPEIQPLYIARRPLIQVYISGDSVISCFLGGMAWEQDVTAVDDYNELIYKYHFAVDTEIKHAEVTGADYLSANGDYNGVVQGNYEDGTAKAELRHEPVRFVNTDTHMTFEVYLNELGKHYVRLRIVQDKTNTVLYEYREAYDWQGTYDIDLTPPAGSPATGKAHVYFTTRNIYARYLLDVEKFMGLDTYLLPSDDIAGSNRNYHRVIGYALGTTTFSDRMSDEPTEYGRTDTDQYFMPPVSCGVKFYPLAQSTWSNFSLWFFFSQADDILDIEGRHTYKLKDAWPLASAINVLLAQFAPDVKFYPTEEYSQFFYSEYNPLTRSTWKLYVTQKSNILAGEYSLAAQKAPATLKQFLDMLKNVFQCYWHVEGDKLRIEHISWYMNGGSYSVMPEVGYDLTQLENIRNGKKWAFASSEYSWDKEDMPQRYQFEWMDECTTLFQGEPMEVMSAFVKKDKTEEVNVANFSADIDYMLLNPEAISSDGFALLCATQANALKAYISGNIGGGSQGTDSEHMMKLDIVPAFRGQEAALRIYAMGGGVAQVEFFDSGGNSIYSGSSFGANGETLEYDVTIPAEAAQMSFHVLQGHVNITIYSMRVKNALEVPFITLRRDGVNHSMQNGYLSFAWLQPNLLLYNMPAWTIKVNGEDMEAKSIQRNKKQTVTFPTRGETIDLNDLVRTDIGNGQIEKISINLSSRMAKATLQYDTTEY
ncbi:MAG: hypothetical protein NC344_06905 [Bacteroidales bacterium]|nr:hypothetical protein [Bacteroidales bacterium]MCM1147546.1 hypothetical protein [Bacteroidales bacterium]MCM1206336.1 hypothetical protein [Bacillota bacterium]MCM1511235.1 hypothetical protein [Clostridium sp.]